LAVAGIGIAAARGPWLLAIIATAGVVIVLRVFDFLEKSLELLWDKREKKENLTWLCQRHKNRSISCEFKEVKYGVIPDRPLSLATLTSRPLSLLYTL
jgi:uncharacterized membrane protein YhiD involved in acid resistance